MHGCMCVYVCVCFENSKPTTPTSEAPCGVCHEQEEKGAAFSFVSLCVRTVSLSQEEKKVQTHTHRLTHAHARNNNNNIYSGRNVCPHRKFLRTELLPGAGNFPLRKTQHTHTHIHTHTCFYTSSPTVKLLIDHKETEAKEAYEGEGGDAYSLHLHYLWQALTKTQDSLTLIHPHIQACSVQTQL